MIDLPVEENYAPNKWNDWEESKGNNWEHESEPDEDDKTANEESDDDNHVDDEQGHKVPSIRRIADTSEVRQIWPVINSRSIDHDDVDDDGEEVPTNIWCKVGRKPRHVLADCLTKRLKALEIMKSFV